MAEIAAGNGVAQPTVRNQIREIFAKPGVRRQVDLVGLLRGVPGPAGGKPPTVKFGLFTRLATKCRARH